MATLTEMYSARFNKLKELTNQIYEEMYAIEQVKGFENLEVWKPDFFMHYILDTLRGNLMKNTYNVSWEESAQVYTWLKTLSFGPPAPPPKPVVHKPLENVTYIKAADYVNNGRQHTVYDNNFEIIRYQDGNGNWIERRAVGDYTLV
jgi:hypothetical protein